MLLWDSFSSLEADAAGGAVTTDALENFFRLEAGKKAHALEVAFWAARAAKLEVRKDRQAGHSILLIF